MNYERWGQSLGVDVMPSAQPTLQVPMNTSTKTSSGTSTAAPTPQLVAMLPQIMGAVAQGIAQGTRPSTSTVPSNLPVQPDSGVPEVPCSDGYYRDATGLCQLMPGAMPGTAPPPMTYPDQSFPGYVPSGGQNVPGTAQPVAPLDQVSSYALPIATFVGGCVVGAVAMHFYMRPKKSVTSNRGRRSRRNRRSRR